MRGQKSYRGKCRGGGARRCLKGADVLLGQMSRGRCPGGRCPKGANVLQGWMSYRGECPGADVQGAVVLRGQIFGGTSLGGSCPGGKCPDTPQYLHNFLSKATNYSSHMLLQRWEVKISQKESSAGYQTHNHQVMSWHAHHWANRAGQIDLILLVPTLCNT